MAWEQIVIIGTGPLACECLASARKTTARVICIEPEMGAMSRLAALCRQSGTNYHRETDRAVLRKLFEAITVPTLVVSAYNNYIFPRFVVESQNLLLVNFHNSLLPRHPGRNAPTWSIFEEDEESGVTWHLVQPAIDAGDIVFQASMTVPPLVRAIELTRQTLELGGRTFRDLLPRLWSGDYSTRPQTRSGTRTLRKSTDIPNDGKLDLSLEPHRISALLRSVDYGGLPVFPQLRLTLDGQEYVVVRYSIERAPGISSNTAVSPRGVRIQGDELLIQVSLAEGEKPQ
jgi:methionyl-tRNA formyltransferase